ncbi:MFS transporter [Nocardia sp. NPDC047648]|uniref:MFS transporter n=1 Tax=Nocardia sp. NPDC047648 TaxID=3155625 RepID=UPI00341135B0
MHEQHTQGENDGRLSLTPRRGTAIFGLLVIGDLSANLAPLMILAMDTDLGLRESSAGTVLAGHLVANAVACLIAARWAAQGGRRRLALAGLVTMAVGCALAAAIPSRAVAAVGIVVSGFGGGGVAAAGGAALAALRGSNRAVALSGLINRILAAAVLALVPALGIRMSTTFGVVAALALLGTCVTSWLPTPTAQSRAVDLRKASAEPTGRIVVAGRVLLACFAVWAVGEDSLWAVTGTMGAANAALTQHQIGLALSASTAGGILAALVLAVVGSRFGRTVPVVAGLLAGGALKLTACIVTEPSAYLAVIIAWNTIYAAVFMYVIAIAAALDPSGRWSASAIGAYILGSSVAPLFGTVVSESLGYRAFGYCLAVISLTVTIPLAAIARSSDRIENSCLATAPARADKVLFQ